MASNSETVQLTHEQMMRMIPNAENHLAWCIASGLAGWMQLCCAKIIGYHIREDPARMILVEILQAQRQSKWLRINQAPAIWKDAPGGARMDVCLGDEKDDVSRFGAIELKWALTVDDSNRSSLRLDVIQDLARLVTVATSEPPNARYFVFGCMEQAESQLFGKAHEADHLEVQRKLFARILSPNLAEPSRNTSRAEIAAAFPLFESRIPADVRLGTAGALRTTLLAAQEVLMGITRLGRVYVWQCDHVRTEISDASNTVAADGGSNTPA